MMPKARFSQKLVLKKVFLSMYELMLVRRVETQNVSKMAIKRSFSVPEVTKQSSPMISQFLSTALTVSLRMR